jgi:hypothetical protein
MGEKPTEIHNNVVDEMYILKWGGDFSAMKLRSFCK